MPADTEVPEAVKSTYKWIEGLSVTEMEIMHGAYRKDNPNGTLPCVHHYHCQIHVKVKSHSQFFLVNDIRENSTVRKHFSNELIVSVVINEVQCLSPITCGGYVVLLTLSVV